jgi:hypothetical protein
MTTNNNRARWRYEPSTSTDEEIEATHAATEIDSDPRPVAGAGPVVWLVWGVVAVFAALGAWHLVAGYVQAWGRL